MVEHILRLMKRGAVEAAEACCMLACAERLDGI
jgi:hypothetical protein